MRPLLLRETLGLMILAGEPMLIKGAPGIGKTDIITQACEDVEAELLIVHPVVDDPTDYKGFPFVVGPKGNQRADFLPFGNLQRIIDATELTVFFLDDLGQAPPSVQAAAMQLILARRINEHRVSDSVVFIAATNRKEDKAGVSGILEPVKSRFTAILELEPTVDDWMRWAGTHNMPTELIAFINFRPNLLHSFEPTADIKNSPCPRTVAAVGRILNLGVTKEQRAELISGAAGEGFAAELEGFLKLYERDLPDPKAMLNDPNKYDIGNIAREPDVAYALIAALADHVTKKTMAAFVSICNRVQPEYSVMGMRLAHIRTPALLETREFAEWAREHQDVFI